MGAAERERRRDRARVARPAGFRAYFGDCAATGRTDVVARRCAGVAAVGGVGRRQIRCAEDLLDLRYQLLPEVRDGGESLRVDVGHLAERGVPDTPEAVGDSYREPDVLDGRLATERRC